MKMPAPNAGIASSRSVQFTSLKELSIIMPTAISAGAVAQLGTALTSGAAKALSRKRIDVNTLVRPVRPPAAMPALDSTKVVTFDVPITEPIDVAHASANSARSILVEKPLPFESAFSSEISKMPLLEPVPISVPTVSNISVMLKAKIVMSTTGNLSALEKRRGMP